MLRLSLITVLSSRIFFFFIYCDIAINSGFPAFRKAFVPVLIFPRHRRCRIRSYAPSQTVEAAEILPMSGSKTAVVEYAHCCLAVSEAAAISAKLYGLRCVGLCSG